MSKFQKNVEKTAKNVDEAIAAALAELGATKDQVNIEVLEEGSKGFFGFGAKDAKVRVTLIETAEVQAETKAEKPAEVKAQPANTAEMPKNNANSMIDVSARTAKAEKFLAEVFSAMQVEVEISTKFNNGVLEIDLKGDDMGIIIGKRGDTLDSLQYLTSLVVNHNEDDYVKVTLDTENYREKRTQALLQLSARLADKVTRSGRKYTLEPMNPYERRIIHSNLQDNEDVTTYSVGDEPYRKVVIAPKNPKPYTPRKPYNNSRRRTSGTGGYKRGYAHDND